ncbi:hypothetical protein BpHYR1_005480 [Brachionus plicatilis]|uniref:Uncharacterized protein n=1 Tax=Brachionus plicatilis TaxID=10195 RepID=A0A3M7S2Y4_BRAPC|nr:hypothetical protein BpHYR1_005480 [Brachionus plicatilis]
MNSHGSILLVFQFINNSSVAFFQILDSTIPTATIPTAKTRELVSISFNHITIQDFTSSFQIDLLKLTNF